MKHILAPILLTVFLFPALAVSEEVTLDDLIQRDGIFYEKSSNVPFTGKVTGLQQGRFKNGVMEGPWVSYHENGQLLSEGAFKNGETGGPWVLYYDNGRLSMKGTFKNGKYEGSWVFYYDNGQLEMKGDFTNGEREGLWIDYYDDGQLNRKGNYKNGVRMDEKADHHHLPD